MKLYFYIIFLPLLLSTGCRKKEKHFKVITHKSIPATPKPTPHPNWNKELVILDPGHGGIDSGCILVEGQKIIVEDEHAYDVCVRTKAFLEAKGFKVILTILDKNSCYLERTEGLISPDTNEILTQAPKLPIKSNDKAINARIQAGKLAEDKLKPKKTYWLSIHIDSEDNIDLQGAHIITPYEGDFTKSMIKALNTPCKLLRQKYGVEYHPVGINGTPRKLYVLREDKNPYPRRILLELGNIQNRIDRERMQSPIWRNKWAEAIANGVELASQSK